MQESSASILHYMDYSCSIIEEAAEEEVREVEGVEGGDEGSWWPQSTLG